MNRFILLLLPLIPITAFLNAQDEPSGFLGKKNLVSFNASGSLQILPLFGGQYANYRVRYNESISNFEEQSNLIRNSLNASFLHIRKRNKGLGLMYHYETFRVGYTFSYIQNAYDFNGQTLFIDQVESPEFISHSIKPNFVWTAKESFLPVGFRGILGIGPRFVSLNTRRDYYVAAFVPTSNPSNPSKEIYRISKIPEEVKINFSALEFSYNGIIAYPVSKSLLIEFGFAFRTAYTLSYEETLAANIDYYANQDLTVYGDVIDKVFYTFDYSDMVKRQNWRNIFSMNLGLSFAF
jgi:hypothetical protein